jgi:gamma-glutamyl hydrolase
VVGIQTMPVNENADFWRPKKFIWSQYTWEHNVNLVRYAGTHAAVVKYDMPLDELEKLLDKMNGFYLTGGPLNLIDPVTKKQHPWYQQAKFIVNYAIEQYDMGRYFPVFGICQGFETIQMIINEDRLDTLSKQTIYAKSRRINWFVDDPTMESRTYAYFPKTLIKTMASNEYALHAHDYVVGIETHNNSKKLNEFYNVLATDTARQPDGKLLTFVTALESKRYPISGTMFHPET